MKTMELRKIIYAAIAVMAAGCAPKAQYVPAPEPVSTDGFTVGVFRCPLWYEKTRPGCWDAIKPYPGRTPVLGYYNEACPEVVDWEIKYALDHGISFFWECWFREKGNEGSPEVKASLDDWLWEGFFKARYGGMINFAIVWENANAIAAGVSGEKDLLENLLPYWIENFFSRPNYQRVDGKPLLMIYGYNDLIEDLGGVGQTSRAIGEMKRICAEAGLGGLYVMAEHHMKLDVCLRFLADAGFDAVTSYHWPSFSGKMPVVPGDIGTIVDLQQECWEELAQASGMPSAVTLSMGWDSRPWGGTYYKGEWHITPDQFEQLAFKAKDYALRQPSSPVSRLILLDNWNEYGEGHYIFPVEQFGFGYLDAVRNVFSDAPREHTDYVPEDIGLGPYPYDSTKNE